MSLRYRQIVNPTTTDFTSSTFRQTGSIVRYQIDVDPNERLCSFESSTIVSATGAVLSGNANAIQTRVYTESGHEIYNLNGLNSTIFKGLYHSDDSEMKKHYKQVAADVDGGNLSSGDLTNFNYEFSHLSDVIPKSQLTGRINIEQRILDDPFVSLTALNDLSQSKSSIDLEKFQGVVGKRSSFKYIKPTEYYFDETLTAGSQKTFTINCDGEVIGFFLYAYQSGNKYNNILQDMDADSSGTIDVTTSTGQQILRCRLNDLRYKSYSRSSLPDDQPIYHHMWHHPETVQLAIHSDKLHELRHRHETLRFNITPGGSSVSGGVCIVPILSAEFNVSGERDGKVGKL